MAYSKRFAWLRAFRFRECVTDRVCVWNVFLFGPKSFFFYHGLHVKRRKRNHYFVKNKFYDSWCLLVCDSTFWFGLKVSHFCINKNQTTTFLFWIEMITSNGNGKWILSNADFVHSTQINWKSTTFKPIVEIDWNELRVPLQIRKAKHKKKKNRKFHCLRLLLNSNQTIHKRTAQRKYSTHLFTVHANKRTSRCNYTEFDIVPCDENAFNSTLTPQ